MGRWVVGWVGGRVDDINATSGLQLTTDVHFECQLGPDVAIIALLDYNLSFKVLHADGRVNGRTGGRVGENNATGGPN